MYIYFRTLNLAKSIIKEKLSVRSKEDKVIDLSKDGKIEKVSFSLSSHHVSDSRFVCQCFLTCISPIKMQIMRAKTCDELHKVVGEDFWVATWCDSNAFEG